MSLRIRRGSDQERVSPSFIPDAGELIWVNSTTTSRPAYKLYVGDGFTAGGKDILETSAGTGLTYNTNTGRLDVSGLSTTTITEGTNQYFTVERAQDAVRDLFANGTMSGITFVYDDLTNRMNVTVTATGGGGGGGSGITALIDDPNPTLGGTFNLNNQNITGAGNVNITGDLIATGTLSLTTGLGANLILNGNDITGSGNINVTGDISSSGTIAAFSGLGADLPLNSFDINGAGNISIAGYLSVSGLGDNLDLNGFNVSGIGNINITGNITASGSLTAGSFLTSGAIAGDSLTLTGTLSNGDITVNNNELYSPTSVTNAKLRLDTFFNVEGKSIDVGNGTETTATFNVLVAGTSGNLKVLQDAPIYAQLIKTHNGTGYVDSAALAFTTSGTITTGASTIPMSLSVLLGDGTNDIASTAGQFNFSNNGLFSAPILKTGVFTSTPETRPTGTKGMIIFNDTLGKFQGFNGTVWVDLS